MITFLFLRSSCLMIARKFLKSDHFSTIIRWWFWTPHPNFLHCHAKRSEAQSTKRNTAHKKANHKVTQQADKAKLSTGKAQSHAHHDARNSARQSKAQSKTKPTKAKYTYTHGARKCLSQTKKVRQVEETSNQNNAFLHYPATKVFDHASTPWNRHGVGL